MKKIIKNKAIYKLTFTKYEGEINEIIGEIFKKGKHKEQFERTTKF